MPEKSIPDAFVEHNHHKFQRTVRLTQQAIAKLETQKQPVTLAALCEVAREFDEQGKGLRPITVLRNPEAAELFRIHSPAYQARQRKVKTARRKNSGTKAQRDVRAPYRGLRSADFIQIIEDLKVETAALKALHDQLRSERDEARRLRDEALQQNARQLAALTKLYSQNTRHCLKLLTNENERRQ